MGEWKMWGEATRGAVESALAAHEDVVEADFAVSGSEINANRPDTWRIEAWLERRPTRADRAALAALFAGDAPDFTIEKLPDTDWVTLSQGKSPPIRAGRFHVHTPDFPATERRGLIDIAIPASQAFGTGQHETTAGCLAMLSAMRREGILVRNFADIGTGTGLLAFAARALWPRTLGLASDIDPVCATVIAQNAAQNAVPLGGGRGEIVPVVAAGVDDPLIGARAPYDLVIANILAGPLIALAPAFGRVVLPGGHLLLAGLLATQEAAVRAAAFRAGFRLARRETRSDWSILWLRRRAMRASPR